MIHKIISHIYIFGIVLLNTDMYCAIFSNAHSMIRPLFLINCLVNIRNSKFGSVGGIKIKIKFILLLHDEKK